MSATDIPETVGGFLPAGDLSKVLRGLPYPVVDEERTRIAHFRYRSTLTTVIIEPAHLRATCVEFANPATDVKMRDANGDPVPGDVNAAVEPPACQVIEGLEVLAWDQGGKNPDGSEDVTPLMDAPPISVDQAVEIAISEVWFE